MAYAEIYITETLWPDFDRSEFHQALCSYQQRERRFGKKYEEGSGSGSGIRAQEKAIHEGSRSNLLVLKCSFAPQGLAFTAPT